jgi:arylsulfatase A-like enzyme
VLEKLAADGILFENAYAPMSTTGPVHATLFTGLHVLSHGVVKNGHLLEQKWDTLAEQLAAVGYDTAGFISSFPIDGKFGYGQGFDIYDDQFVPGENSVETRNWEGIELENAFDRKGPFTTDKALGWLANRPVSDDPFFMFVHYFDAHAPYQPHEGFAPMLDGINTLEPLDQHILLYDQEIAVVDHEIGRVVDELAASGLMENTIIIVTADHGEGLMDHGHMAHGVSVHEEEVRVPLIIYNPSMFEKETIPHPVGLQDILPVIAEWVGLDAMEKLAHVKNDAGQTVEIGLDFFDTNNQRMDRPMVLFRRHYEPGMVHTGLPAANPNDPPQLAFKVHGEQYGIVVSNEKYIVDPELGIQQLFHLKEDPGEKNNLYKQHTARGKELHLLLEKWVGTNRLETAPEFLDESDKDALESLGYVQK